MTPDDLSTVALRRIGAYGPSETPSADVLLNVYTNYLQAMLDQWAIQRLTINGLQKSSLAVIVAHNPYTIGTGGDFNQVRPTWVPIVTITIPGTVPVDLNIEIVDVATYAKMIQAKTTPSSIPSVAYYDQAGPTLGNLNLWPIPNNATYTLNIWVPVALAQFTGQQQSLTLLPGFKEAITWNLAALLLSEWGRADQATVGMIRQNAAEALGWIKRANMSPSFLQCDPGLLRSGAIIGGGDWYVGP